MKYRLFCSDFDGTLVRADGTISERTKRAIGAYVDAGGIFTIVTGRMLSSILPRVRETGIKKGVIAAYQGGFIYDIGKNTVLRVKSFRRAEAKEILVRLEKDNHHIHLYTKEGLFASRRDEALSIYERVCGVTGCVPDVPLSEFTRHSAYPVLKILIMIEAERRDALLSDLKARFGQKYHITTSNSYMVEITPHGADKGSAIKFLSEYYNIAQSEVAAIGDEMNDMSMLDAAGGRFTVENGAEALKKIAKTVASCEEDGVAEALEWVMNEKGGNAE